MLYDDVKAEPGVLDRTGQHVAEEGIQQQGSRHDNQRPACGAAGDFQHQQYSDAGEELVPRRHVVDIAHAGGDFRKVHGEIDRCGNSQRGATQIDQNGDPALLFAFGQFSARDIKEDKRGDKGDIGDPHHGTVQHAKPGGEPDLEQRQRKTEQPGNGFYSLPG